MYIACPCKKFAVRVVGDPAEIEDLLGENSPNRDMPCPECKDRLYYVASMGPEVLEELREVLRELTPMEAHLALNGVGFPEERDCVAEIVRAVMRQSIRSVDVKTIRGTTKCEISSITMEDGTTVFLGGGAIVYRIRKPHPFVSKVT